MKTTEQKNSFARSLVLDLLGTFVLALIVFGPLTGIQLQGFDFVANWQRPIYLAVIVTLGRGLMRCIMQTAIGQKLFSREKVKRPAPENAKTVQSKQRLFVIGVAVVALIIPFFIYDNSYVTKSLILALIYVLLGLGLNIVVGLAGLLDLGYVAFYAVGAYCLALGSQYLGIGFWSAIILAPILAAVLAAIIAFPVLRTHGDYIAIVTLGFGEIIRLVLTNWMDFTGGPNGAQAPPITFFGLEFTRTARYGGTPFHEFFNLPYQANTRFIFTYIVLVLVVLLMIFFVNRLRMIPMGRAWEALREDEIACKSLGMNHVAIKLSAFAIGAMTGGIAGVFFASYQGFVNPTSFTFFESALILAIVVLGGLGSITGVVIAAFILTLLPELLREFADYRILAFGTLMVLMMVWRPRGLITAKRPVIEVTGATNVPK